MSRLLTLLPAAALTAAALTATSSPAQAAVTLDCSTGPVTITSSTEDYVLTGACSNVTVTASNVTVALAGAARLDISGANVDVTSTGPIDTGLADRRRLDECLLPPPAPQRSAPATWRYKIDALDSVKMIGSNNSVKATSGTTVKVKGANNRLVYTKLENLVIKGANNKATVKKGATKVSVKGPNNVVRVHKRLRP